MGTDIHCYVERRSKDGWQHCPLEFYCGQERNYVLFRILAGVERMTNGGFESISPPRGLPTDLSPQLREYADPNATGEIYGHNHSWLSLKELQDFPWHEKVRKFASFVDAEQFAYFRTHGRPQSFSNDSGKVVSNEEMERLVSTHAETEGILTLISFGIPYAEFAGPFVTETLPLLRTLGEPDDVRLVFWFDS